MMKIGIMKSKKSVTYVEKRFAIIRIKKGDLNYTKKLEIIVILQENLEEQLMKSAIYTKKYPKKFL